MLTEVANGVWVRTSEWVSSNSTVIATPEGLVLVDPGISGSDLEELADDLDQLGSPVVAGFSTHLHWDHLLWHSRFGDVPRYAMPASAAAAPAGLERAQAMATESATDVPLELIGLVAELPADGGALPGEVIPHDAHAIGHAALLLREQRLLVAGDMLSDLLVPMPDPRRDNQLEAYAAALDLLEKAASHADVLIPGHGTIARGPEIAARIELDRAFIQARLRGEQPDDSRAGPR